MKIIRPDELPSGPRQTTRAVNLRYRSGKLVRVVADTPIAPRRDFEIVAEAMLPRVSVVRRP
jgi:hypothetical protein